MELSAHTNSQEMSTIKKQNEKDHLSEEQLEDEELFKPELWEVKI